MDFSRIAMDDHSHPFVKAGLAVGGATAVNVVVLTEWLQLLAAFCAAVYSVIVLIEWWIRRRKK